MTRPRKNGNEQRIAFSVFKYIRTRCTPVLTTFQVTFVSTSVSPGKGGVGGGGGEGGGSIV